MQNKMSTRIDDDLEFTLIANWKGHTFRSTCMHRCVDLSQDDLVAMAVIDAAIEIGLTNQDALLRAIQVAVESLGEKNDSTADYNRSSISGSATASLPQAV